MEIKSNELFFAKVKEEAVIPNRENENAGLDIYSCFDEDYIKILPHTTVMIPTGIASVFTDDYVAVLKERGSTGTKGIAQRCGIIDSGFRGEWKVPVTNTTDKILVIAKDKNIRYSEFIIHSDSDLIIYPYTKAICQALILPVPKMKIKEISYEELAAMPSQRGSGMLGSSGK